MGNAERAFKKMAEERNTNNKDPEDNDNEQQQPLLKKCKYTILRLGALTDDAGMVPLVFGKDDSTTNNRPPILSRADAARISTFLVRKNDVDVDRRSNSSDDDKDNDNESDSDSDDDDTDLYGNNDD